MRGALLAERFCRVGRFCQWLVLGLLLTFSEIAAKADSRDVLLSKHNLSVSGPGPVTSQTQDACMFCHTPHVALTDVRPAWNHGLPTQTYATYTSSTYEAAPATPTVGVSKLCLSCHDGTIALGQTVSDGLIPTTGNMRPDAVLGTALTNDHPLGIKLVDDGQLVLSLFQTLPRSNDPAVKLPVGRIECTTCHDPHKQDIDPVARKFLVRSNNGGTLCLACHEPNRAQPNALNGWVVGAHASAANTVPKASSFGPYGSVDANACGNCHQLHGTGAVSAARLLRGSEEGVCSPCHSGANVSPVLLNVMREFEKVYAHPTVVLSGLHDPVENAFPLSANRHAECADCHNPHAAAKTGGSENPPMLQRSLLGTSGYNGGTALRPAANEYEICFKCHADNANKPQNTPGYSQYGRTPRRLTDFTVADSHNLRLKFASTISRHNVSNPRQRTSAHVPSLRMSMLNLDGSQGRSMAAGTSVYCTDCHSNDQARQSRGAGPNGPHGSTWAHLLERRYDLETPPAKPGGSTLGVVYRSGVSGSAGLCSKCHDIEGSILVNQSFKQHSQHVQAAGAACSTCHDPHGIHGGNVANNGSMVNFDVDVVGPSSGNILRYERTAISSGRCYLTCHGRDHNPASY